MSLVNVLPIRAVALKMQGDGASSFDNNPQDAVAMDFAAVLSGWLAQTYGQGQIINSGTDNKGKDANLMQNALSEVDDLQALFGMLKESDTQIDQAVQVALMNVLGGNLQNNQLSPQTSDFDPSLLRTIQANIESLPVTFEGGVPLKSDLAKYKSVISELLAVMSGDITVKDVALDSKSGLSSSPTKNVPLSPEMHLRNLVITQPSDFSNTQPITVTGVDVKPPVVKTAVPSNNPSSLVIPQDSAPLISTVNTFTPLQGDQKDVPSKGQIKSQALSAYGIPIQSLDSVEPTVTSVVASVALESSDVPLEMQKTLQNKITPVVQQVVSASPQTPDAVNLATFNNPLQVDDQPSKTTAEEASPSEVRVVSDLMYQPKVDSIAEDLDSRQTGKPVWNQVADEIINKAYRVTPQVKELAINLHPSELGHVKISLTWDNGQVHLKMVASEVGTGQLLQSNFSELKDSLSQMGVQCGTMEMGSGDPRGNQHQQPADFLIQARTHSDEDSATPQTSEVTYPSKMSKFDALNSSNRIDVTA